MKYAPSLLGIGQLSGSGGSVTASHNRYGTYFRNRTIPTNPNSISQQGVRGVFGGLAQRWRTLTASQRLGWSLLAPNVPRTNSLGQTYVLAGNALYSATNLLRDAVGSAVLDDAPALDSPPIITSATLTVSVAGLDGISLAYTATGGLAGNDIIIRATAPRSPGRDYTSRSELKQITTILGNAASPIGLEAFYETVFGAGWETQIGNEIVVEMFPVSANGLPGVGVKAEDPIAA